MTNECEISGAALPVRDGGPAFPVADVLTHDGMGLRQGSEGMTLRDYFAAAALTGLLARSPQLHPIGAAHDAYIAADAILAAREVKP